MSGLRSWLAAALLLPNSYLEHANQLIYMGCPVTMYHEHGQ